MRQYTHSEERERRVSCSFCQTLSFRLCLFLAAALCWCCCVPSLCEPVTSPRSTSHWLTRTCSFHTLTHLVFLPRLVEHSVLNLLCSCMFVYFFFLAHAVY